MEETRQALIQACQYYDENKQTLLDTCKHEDFLRTYLKEVMDRIRPYLWDEAFWKDIPYEIHVIHLCLHVDVQQLIK
jgi:hypothetical protein